MSDERTTSRKISDDFPIIFAVALVFLGFYTYSIYFRENFAISFLLFIISSLSMILIFTIWRKFTERYAHEIIFWTTQHKWVRKAVAGGSFSYYEYKDNIYKIGLFEPVSRFISMMIAFIGISTTFANTFGLAPSSPVEDINSAIIWAILIVLVPIILTPIVPIIWAMEDLQLKSWNAKLKTNLNVSRRYKARFNSFIAVGTLGVAFSLSRGDGIPIFESAINFLNLLGVALVVLVYPIAVLTLLYYVYFRGTVIDKIRDRMSLPMAETKLIYRNTKGQILDSDGNVLAEKPEGEKDLVAALITGKASPTEAQLDPEGETRQTQQTDQNVEGEDKNLPQKIGDGVVGTGKAIVDGITGVGKSISDNTVGRLFGKKKDEPTTDKDDNKVSTSSEPKSEYKYKGGSATAGLWDHDDDEKKSKKKK